MTPADGTALPLPDLLIGLVAILVIAAVPVGLGVLGTLLLGRLAPPPSGADGRSRIGDPPVGGPADDDPAAAARAAGMPEERALTPAEAYARGAGRLLATLQPDALVPMVRTAEEREPGALRPALRRPTEIRRPPADAQPPVQPPGQPSARPKRGAGSGGATAAGVCSSSAKASATPRAS
ncbi:hypothetical protein ACXET9_12515 [Brachybacterium sp. DNPG3]